MIQRRIMFLFLTVFLAIPVLPAAAQTPVASFPPDAGDLAGIQVAVYRDYVTAGMLIGSGTVGLIGTPMTEDDLVTNRASSISVFVYEFDTSDNAAVAFDRLSDGLAGSLVGLSQDTVPEDFATDELADLGTESTLARLVLTSKSNGQTNETTFEYVTVQRDEYVFVVTTLSNRGPYEGSLPNIADLPSPAIALATELANNGQASDAEASFSEDGTSTGGLWGFMPAEGDPFLLELVPFMDTVLYPAPGQ